MSKWPMRGHFRYLRFKTFPMTPRTPQCKVFWAFLSNSKHSGVPEDSKSPTLEVLGFTPTLGQSGVATKTMNSEQSSYMWSYVIFKNFELRSIFLYFASIKFCNHEPTWFSYLWPLLDSRTMNLDEFSYIWPLSYSITMKVHVFLSFYLC
jgi:hypothetical protein